jgi:hypothetical protein
VLKVWDILETILILGKRFFSTDWKNLGYDLRIIYYLKGTFGIPDAKKIRDGIYTNFRKLLRTLNVYSP